ncbi:bifunctional chorismate mutase/prephenate dehydrogenase [Pleionea litopenaei]|uniref:chorismate mutase n=1 Tax=Pleionea litopenaei TaxID=3070815 RepID=A0AA51X6S7_9GAMM|nr:bifunctional chorismate mutase/prephenate dehydrogenase [Pleionea sp. HL-JVS1]WMS87174.1 bifunctional chorismate mutase/prephenate dehydrogenase [Pleionea sp. HL-JVS1]
MPHSDLIADIRSQIDDCDEALLEVLARRQSLVEQLVAHKAANGEALRVPKREALIYSRLDELAAKKGLNAQLVVDIFQRIMRDSYERQASKAFPCASLQPKDIVIIGGKGQLGSLFAKLFERSGHQVTSLDKNEWHSESAVLAQADLVIVAVPINVTLPVIEQLTALKPNCILADLTSVKNSPLSSMLKAHSGPVVGLHPMFGPGATQIARQLILVSEGRQIEAAQWMIAQFKLWGCDIQSIGAKHHDELMSQIQGVRHFVVFILGWQLQTSGTDLSELLRCSSPIYRMELALTARLFNQNPELYVDILLNAQNTCGAFADFDACARQGVAWLKSNDRDALINVFKQVAEYFSSEQSGLFQDSERLLEAYRERISGQVESSL